MYWYDFFFSSRRRHTRYWRDWSSDVCSSDLLQPPARKPRAAEAADDVRVPLHEIPQQSRSIILDHEEDRPLVDPEVVAVEPAAPGHNPAVLDPTAELVRRIERVEKAVLREEIGPVRPAHVLEGRDRDLRRERHRPADRRRCECAVVDDLVRRGPARAVREELPHPPAESYRRVLGAVDRSEAPEVGAVATPPVRVLHRVRSLRQR